MSHIWIDWWKSSFDQTSSSWLKLKSYRGFVLCSQLFVFRQISEDFSQSFCLISCPSLRVVCMFSLCPMYNLSKFSSFLTQSTDMCTGPEVVVCSLWDVHHLQPVPPLIGSYDPARASGISSGWIDVQYYCQMPCTCINKVLDMKGLWNFTGLPPIGENTVYLTWSLIFSELPPGADILSQRTQESTR